MRLRSFAPSPLLACALALFTAQACGPDFRPDVFVQLMHPDKPKEFAAGKLGVLLPTYPRQDLAVAFRYLNGGTLNAVEQAAYTPTYSFLDPEWEKQWDAQNGNVQGEDDPAANWKKLRAQYSVVPAAQPQGKDAQGGFVEQSDYDNCNADAYATAAATMQARAKTWGAQSVDFAEWLRGQDAVFGNCAKPGAAPGDAPATSSALLKADRAYQQAAAHFYAGNFADARTGFEAIAQNAESPWSNIAPYLAARCLVRQAFHDAKAADWGEMAAFDPALMKQAADSLSSLLKENKPGAPRRAIENELDLVRLRTDTLHRVGELGAALAGPKSDANYTNHLRDLTWYLNNKLDSLPVRSDFSDPSNGSGSPDFDKPYADLAELRGTGPLVDWVITFQSPASAAQEHALTEWRSTHERYWLLAALAKATGKESADGELVTAAAAVPSGSPAWESFTFYRARLMIAMGRGQEARALLEQSLPQVRADGRDSSINLFRELEADASTSLKDFLIWAPRKTINTVSESKSSLDECLDVMKNPKRVYDCSKKVEPVQFSSDAAGFFNTQAPVATLVDAANDAALPQQLRTSIAMMAWVRSVLLKDDATAQKLLPLLPEKLREQAGPGNGLHSLMAILRNPGLRPYLDPGVQRSYSYDFVESYADNWWCNNWQTTWNEGNMSLSPTESRTFLDDGQRKEASAELSKLTSEQGSAVYLGGLIIDYANAHPDDKDVPESLYLLLRMIRYGCERATSQYDNNPDAETKRVTELRKEASRLLRQRYTTDPWTKKAAPIAG